MTPIDEQAIKDRLTKTCTCRVVSRAAIEDAIANGADTLEKIRAQTGAMAGCCHGRKCKERIEELLEDAKMNKI